MAHTYNHRTPSNRPGSIFDKYGIHDAVEEDQRYCGGHRSNRLAKQKWNHMLRSKIKTETKNIIRYECNY